MERKCLNLIVLVLVAVLAGQPACRREAKVARQGKAVVGTADANAVSKQSDKGAARITFEKKVYDFGEVGPGTRKKGEFKFTNTGDGVLKISEVQQCCGVTTKLDKKEFAPGESGILNLEYRVDTRPGKMSKYLYVQSNDKATPRVALAIKATIARKVVFDPPILKLLLKDENVPDITLTSADGTAFSIKQFKSTANCITADYDPSIEATKFVLRPRIDMERLRRGLNGLIEISLTHPQAPTIAIPFNALPRFKLTPPQIIVFEVEPKRPIVRNVWILNNYEEEFEIKSTSSSRNIVKVLDRKKIKNGYELQVKLTPPAAGSQTMFSDVLFIETTDGEKLSINCRGFYVRKGKH